MSPLPDPATLARPWVTGYPPGVPADYRIPPVGIPRLLDDAARDFPERPAVVADGASVDHTTLASRVAAVAAVLADAGVGPGTRVVVALPNGQAAPVVLLALWRLAAVVVPVDPATPGDRLAGVVADARAGAAVGTAPALQAVRAAADGDGPGLTTFLVAGDEWPTGRRLARLRGLRRRGAGDAVVLADHVQQPPAVVLPPAAGPDAPALVAHDGAGDGGHATVHSHRNLVAGAFQVRLWMPDVQAGRERMLVPERLDSVDALTAGWLTGLLSAATVVLEDDPDPGDLVRAVERHAPTLLVAGASRLGALAEEAATARHDLSSLRVCLAVRGVLDPAAAGGLEHATTGARVRGAFSVAGAGLALAQPVYGRVEAATVGVPLTGTLAAGVDPDDPSAPRPAGEAGRLVVHGPQVAAVHERCPDRAGGCVRDGWLVTREVVRMDERGVFTHVGRAGELVRTRDGPVSPARVRAALERHPAVRRAAVGVDDEGVLVAAVVPRRRARVSPDAILAHCGARLEAAGVPRTVLVVDELPDTTGELSGDDLERLRTEG